MNDIREMANGERQMMNDECQAMHLQNLYLIAILLERHESIK
jgi:hypothetical protein